MSRRINVTRSSMPSFEEYCAEIAPLWDTHWLTNGGIKHQELEKRLKDYLEVDNLALFVNGHSALECVLETMELGIDGRDEVITTPFTFASTTNAIVRKGLKPVFADIKIDDYTIDPAKIEPLITDRTCAILPVHVYGNICDVDAIQQIADTYGLKVIYDAAHAFGVKRNGVPVVLFGDASALSFHATKVFNTIEGGAVVHADPDLHDKLAQWRNFGIVDETHVAYPGGNAKLNEFSAAMGICNLRHVDEEIARRRILAQRYWERLKEVPGIIINRPASDVTLNYAYLPIVVDHESYGMSRDELRGILSDEGIGARRYFYPLTNEFDCYDFDASNTPIARMVSRNVLAMPIYADLDIDEVDEICDLIVAHAREVG